MLLLWPGEVRRKREDDFGRIGPALFAGTNISDQSIKEISSTSYSSLPMLFSLYPNAIKLPADARGTFDLRYTRGLRHGH